MKTSISFLSSNYDFFKTIDLINDSIADYIHVDVMDGLFVNNKTPFDKKMLVYLKESKKSKDVHLMTLHLKKFIDLFSYIEPEYITYPLEATTNHLEFIEYIKEKKCKAGLAISPLTDINKLIPYLNKVDLILVMSVIPGYGGQEFLKETPRRIKKLLELKKEYKAKFKISVDGGINEESIPLVKGMLDMVVAGSYVCKHTDFNKQINKLK